ncbi:hypothetical protein Ahia01_001309000 [Argonauta hians]
MDIERYYDSVKEYIMNNPPPKPAHGIIRTDFSMPVPSTTYSREEEEEDGAVNHADNSNNNKKKVNLRRKTNDSKKFVHFRASRDITYYPEPYGVATTASGEDNKTGFYLYDMERSLPVYKPQQSNETTDDDTTIVSGYESSGRISSNSFNDNRHPPRIQNEDETHQLTEQPLRSVLQHQKPTNPSQSAIFNHEDSYRSHPYYSTNNKSSINDTTIITQPMHKVRLENYVDSITSDLKVFVNGPVYGINRNAPTRSSGTFISVIGRIQSEEYQTRKSPRENVTKQMDFTENIKMLHKTLAINAKKQQENIYNDSHQRGGSSNRQCVESNGKDNQNEDHYRPQSKDDSIDFSGEHRGQIDFVVELNVVYSTFDK